MTGAPGSSRCRQRDRGHDRGHVAGAGARVIRCGITVDVGVRADLGEDDGRAVLVREVHRLAPEGVDGLALVAGIGAPTAATLRVDYFGTLAVLIGLRVRCC